MSVTPSFSLEQLSQMRIVLSSVSQLISTGAGFLKVKHPTKFVSSYLQNSYKKAALNYLPFENARNGISTENPKEGTSETEQPHQTATTCVKEAKVSNSQGQNKKTTRSSRCS